MPRMFDILRGKAEPPKTEAKEPLKKKDAPPSVSFPRQIKEVFRTQNEEGHSLEVSRKLIDAVRNRDLDNSEIADERYKHTLGVVKALLGRVAGEEGVDLGVDEIYKTIDALTNQLILGNSLLENVALAYPAEQYLPRHITNVCILSLVVGMQMKLNKSKLHTLGMASLFHDLGMLKVEGIAAQSRRLTEGEFTGVKRHILKGAEIVSKMGGSYDGVRQIIEQHHERMNGSGYPLGLREHEINDYAKIIGLVDTYEAMTHARPHRRAKVQHQAIREIMSSLKLSFEYAAIKALVNKLSLYPIGSFVVLNGGEIAKVISTNVASPLRPVVLVVLDFYGQHLSKPKAIDLSKEGSIYIKEPISLVKPPSF